MSGKMVVVFAFPEPEDGLTLPFIVQKAKSLFEDQENVRIYAAVNDPADKIVDLITNVTDKSKEETEEDKA